MVRICVMCMEDRNINVEIIKSIFLLIVKMVATFLKKKKLINKEIYLSVSKKMQNKKTHKKFQNKCNLYIDRQNRIKSLRKCIQYDKKKICQGLIEIVTTTKMADTIKQTKTTHQQ